MPQKKERRRAASGIAQRALWDWLHRIKHQSQRLIHIVLLVVAAHLLWVLRVSFLRRVAS